MSGQTAVLHVISVKKQEHEYVNRIVMAFRVMISQKQRAASNVQVSKNLLATDVKIRTFVGFW